jgi:hypothetical protein
MRINLLEIEFPEGPARHSRFVAGTLLINKRNPDYGTQAAGSEEEKLAYATLLIGKETMAYNDKRADDSLENLLSFLFQVKERVSARSLGGHEGLLAQRRGGRRPIARRRGRPPRKAAAKILPLL